VLTVCQWIGGRFLFSQNRSQVDCFRYFVIQKRTLYVGQKREGWRNAYEESEKEEHLIYFNFPA
jgi:hypothetical protein